MWSRPSATDRKYEAARYRQMTEEMAAALRTNIPSIVRAQAKREQELPSIDLSKCDYHKATKSLRLVSEYMGMPEQFFVVSHHTGKTVRFVQVGPHDVLYDEDGHDGEVKYYRPMGNVPKVDYLVIYHQY